MDTLPEEEKIAKKELKKASKAFRKRRVTVQERIEIGRYKKMKKVSQEQKVTLSKMLDEAIDCFLCQKKYEKNHSN